MLHRPCGLRLSLTATGCGLVVGCALAAQRIVSLQTGGSSAASALPAATANLLCGLLRRFSKRRLGCCVGTDSPQLMQNETVTVLLYLQKGVTKYNR